MKSPHSQALQSFARRLMLLSLLRAGIQMATLWFFIWGVVVLVVRISGAQQTEWLALGILGFVPLTMAAGARERSRQPAFAKVRASYDRLKACGGILMSEEVSDMTAWRAHLPEASVPKLRWRSRRAMLLLGISALFVALALLLPERLTKFSNHRSLEIGQIVDQLQAEVQALQQEKIVEDKKAEDLQKQLAQLKQDSSGLDPNKTWEALDHIKESNSDAARQAAEEALTKMSELARAETLAKAVEQAADSGMSADTAARAAQDLAGMLAAAKLEDGLLKSEIPPELLSGLNGLNKEQMENLLHSLQFNKDALGKAVGKLAELKMIDAATLSKCNKAGECLNPDALAAYLSTCTNSCDSLSALACSYGRGGLTRGDQPGNTPITWTDGASEAGTKFKEEALPSATHLSDAQLVGVSRAAPDLSGEAVTTDHGALANAAGGGGSAHAQTILPEHRRAVQNFFKRDE